MKLSLKALRVNKNFSQTDLGKQLGVSKSTISRWEQNPNSIPKNKKIMLQEVLEKESK